MIKIVKPAELPEVLRTRGVKKRAVHCQSYTRFATEYDNGTRTFPFDDTIYNHTSVKQALITAQHNKCCFCESHIYGGDVEHFRPKSGFCEGLGLPLMRPGYYWLAYDWNNLFLSCSTCNQRHKKNYFLLAKPEYRAKSHHDDIQQEDALIIHPGDKDPEEYIGFRKEIAYAIDGNPYGKATIETLKLNHNDLSEARREHLAQLLYLRTVLDCEVKLNSDPKGRAVLAGARAFLEQATSDKSEFAAMARAAKANDFRVTLL